jgi:hypothetical protein
LTTPMWSAAVLPNRGAGGGVGYGENSPVRVNSRTATRAGASTPGSTPCDVAVLKLASR